MPTGVPVSASPTCVELFWLPLGAGERTGLVRFSGRVYESLSSRRERRPRQSLYHSALRIVLAGEEFVIEMAPVWSTAEPGRGVVATGPVGLPWLGRFRMFRYEVRCWRGGLIPDQAYAVDSPRELTTDCARAGRLLRAVADFPAYTWGLDEPGTGEMWNSNSLVSWLLARSGHDTETIAPPPGGRAPGWTAGLVVAAAGQPSSVTG
jgi:hypothetical protein